MDLLFCHYCFMLCTDYQHECIIHADPSLVVKDNAKFSSAYSAKIDFGSNKADIELPGILLFLNV